MTSTDNTTAVYGGWGKTPLGFIEGDATLELSYTDAMFYRDLYSISGTGSSSIKDTSIKEGRLCTVLTGPVIELPFQVNTGNVQIAGLELDTTASSGKFSVSYDDTTKVSTITFNEGDVTVGDTVRVTYERRVAQADVTTITTTGGSARGSLTLTWPVMSSGDDCAQASIVGYWHLYVPRVMVTTRASLDTSRGTAATPNIVFSAIDAHRGDNKWYDLIYEELDEGAISTDYSGTVQWNDSSTDSSTAVKLTALTISDATLTPAFNADIQGYSAATTSTTSTITATSSGNTVSIKVNGTAVTSGGTATWNAGNNSVIITVSKAGNASTTYAVTVVKS